MTKTQWAVLAVLFFLLSGAYYRGCGCAKATDKEKGFDLSAFKRYADSMVVNTIEPADSFAIARNFDGDTAAYKATKRTYWIVDSKRGSLWTQMNRYLLMDTVKVKAFANNIGFDSAWYFLQWIRIPAVVHPQKTELMAYVRDTAFKKYKDTTLLTCGNSYLISYVFYEESAYLRKRHAEMHRKQ